MLARTFRRMPLYLLLAMSAAACNDKSASTPTPEPRSTAAAPKDATTAEAKAAPVETAAPAPVETAAPQAAESGNALAANAPSTATSGTSAKTAAAAGGAASAPGGLPKTKSGILAPGAADKILAVGARPAVKLVSPGAEPRAELTYTLDKGAKQTLGMSMDMVMTLKMGAQAMPPMAIPRMVMGLDMATGDKDAGGDWKVNALLQRVSVEAKGAQQQEMAKAMSPQLEGMKGLTMAYFVTPKGHVHDVTVNTPPNFPAQAQQMLQGMNQSFESMVAPLPNEAVGVGAKWEVTTRVVSSGADLLQFATYTLKERSGTRATLDITVTQVAASDTINAPGMPAGAAAKLKSFHSGGGGSTQIDTKSVAPEGGRMSVKSGMDLEVTVPGAGGKQDTSVDTALDVEFTRPKK